MDGAAAVYTYYATTTRSPFEGFDCSFNCMLVDRDILRVLQENEWTEGELYCHLKYCKGESSQKLGSLYRKNAHLYHSETISRWYFNIILILHQE